MAAATVSAFEDTLTRAAVLAIFMPIIAGQSGNAGIQTLTLVVRSMALGDFERRAWRRLLPREAAIGLANGAAIGLFVGLASWLWQNNAWLGLVVGIAALGSMLAASIAGVLIPVGMRLVRADPALASGIFVTTVTDVMGFFMFLGLASLLIDKIA